LDLSVGPLDGIGGGRRGGVGAGTGANADGPTPAADPGATDADTDVDADVDAATDASVDPGATTTTTTTATADRTPAPEGPSRVQFVGCGTSYHAALYGSYALRTAGVPATAHLAHEYAVAPPPAADALVVGVTQSGETADTLAALRTARDRGARTVAVTNAPASTVARECDEALSCRAGREVGVAATKTFTAQLVTVALLADRIRATADGGTAGRPAASRGLASASFREALTALPAQVATVIDESRAAGVAPRLAEADASFFLGRGLDRPIALEGALKLSELTYAHAEGLAAGELKHGPLARVDETTPVVAVLTGDGDPARRTADNVREVLARGAPVVLLTDGAVDAPDATATLEVPATHRLAAPVLTAVQCQLLAFHAAVHLGRDVDRPRHLAKSVTVE
jgi:glucosamine--fructose-6-phosphate aminotransferase (isomerizing)